MKTSSLRRLVGVAPVLIITSWLADGASACSVCFGDPDSAMAKGAAAGVVLLAGVAGFVLSAVAGTGLFWIHRARVLRRGIQDDGESEAGSTKSD